MNREQSASCPCRATRAMPDMDHMEKQLSSLGFSIFEEQGFMPYLDTVYGEIQGLFLEDSKPWVIGYSGGKDSTAVVQLIWQALAKMSPEVRNRKKVYVITTDTLVENPVVSAWVARSLTLMNERALAELMPFESHQLTPKIKNSFWVNMLGRGYPAPRAKFRWCTERLKIWPSNEFILDVVSKHGEAILALGTRKAESQARARMMERHEKGRTRSKLSPNFHIENCLVFTPIEDWSNDDVWLFLTRTENPWGLGNEELLELYMDATEDRECPLIVNMDDSTPSCGASRFGCWVCTMVARDKSLEAMVTNDPVNKGWLAPLIQFRALLDIKNDKIVRDFRRMRGQVQLFHGEPIHGPYVQSQRERLLAELLRTQRQLQDSAPEPFRNITLVTQEELREIRRLWLIEKHEIEDHLPRIYQEATGSPYPDPGLGFHHCFSEEALKHLENVCEGDRLGYELLRELIDVEWGYRTMLRRAGLHDRLEIAVRRAFYEDEDDAVTYAKHVEQLKKTGEAEA